MVDSNDGADYPVDVLRKWKAEHEQWVRENLNKRVSIGDNLTSVNGVHYARGKDNVTGLDIKTSVRIEPGTRSIAEGDTNVTATRISGSKD